MPSLLLRLDDTPPNAQALAYAIRLVRGAYQNDLPSVISGTRDSGPSVIRAQPFPRSWYFTESGTRVLLVEGTTDPAVEIGPQGIGYELTHDMDGGQVNSWYHDAATMISSAIPHGADIVVGHSMGGAIAVEIGRILRQAQSTNCVVAAIASPRGRDAVAANAIGNWATQVVSMHDPIPYLPGSLAGGLDWRHGGRHYVMNDNGDLLAIPENRVDAEQAAIANARWLPTGGHDTQAYLNAIMVAIEPSYVRVASGATIPIIDP